MCLKRIISGWQIIKDDRTPQPNYNSIKPLLDIETFSNCKFGRKSVTVTRNLETGEPVFDIFNCNDAFEI